MRLSLIFAVFIASLAFGLKAKTFAFYWKNQETNEPSPLSDWLFDNKFTSSSNNQLSTDLQNVELETVPLNNRETIEPLDYQRSSCQLVQIVHLLYRNNCQPKAIASFACAGSCSSYVQTSTSKFWQHERSCSCCQQTGLQEATFTLDCPSLDPPYRKVKTYSPADCMCRACTDLGKENIQPQELVEALAASETNREEAGVKMAEERQ